MQDILEKRSNTESGGLTVGSITSFSSHGVSVQLLEHVLIIECNKKNYNLIEPTWSSLWENKATICSCAESVVHIIQETFL